MLKTEMTQIWIFVGANPLYIDYAFKRHVYAFAWFSLFNIDFMAVAETWVSADNVDGILPKGPYPPCLRMADRALLAGYPRMLCVFIYMKHSFLHMERAYL